MTGTNTTFEMFFRLEENAQSNRLCNYAVRVSRLMSDTPTFLPGGTFTLQVLSTTNTSLDGFGQ